MTWKRTDSGASFGISDIGPRGKVVLFDTKCNKHLINSAKKHCSHTNLVLPVRSSGIMPCSRTRVFSRHCSSAASSRSMSARTVAMALCSGRGGIGSWVRWVGSVGALGWEGAFAIGVGGAAPELRAAVFSLTRFAQCHELAAKRAGGELVVRRIRLAGRICRIGPIIFLALALGDAGGGELFGKAATLDEILLQTDELLVEQVVRLVDEAQQGVGPDRGFFMFQPPGVKRPPGIVAGVEGSVGSLESLGSFLCQAMLRISRASAESLCHCGSRR